MSASEPDRPRAAFLENGHLADPQTARVVVLPVPYEGTVSYGSGTARGPSAILEASSQLELYDERLRCEPGACGVWTAPPLELPSSPPSAATAAIERRVGELMDDGRWVLMLGGEHSITPGAVAAAAARHEGLRVVQLDAHADLREQYEGRADSHACAMARCLEFAPVHAIGIRSYSRAEAERIAGGGDPHRIVHGWEMNDPAKLAAALDGIDGAPLWLTIDLDALDPSIMPSTGTPEPGGLDWETTLRVLRVVFDRARVVGADLVELAPVEGVHHPDFTAARLAHSVIGFAFGVSPDGVRL